jgi:broad specificity phosphatase PhoE
MLVLVRHGMTMLNEQGRVQGSIDRSLSAVGREQVMRLTGWINELNLNIERIYSSPACRAIETATLLKDEVSGEIETRDGLRERDFGPFEGMGKEEIITSRHLASDTEKDVLENWVGVEGVEQDDVVLQRAMAALRDIGALSRDTPQDYLVTTHSGVIEVLLDHLLPIATDERKWIKIPPASSVALAVGESSRRLLHLWPNPAAAVG